MKSLLFTNIMYKRCHGEEHQSEQNNTERGKTTLVVCWFRERKILLFLSGASTCSFPVMLKSLSGLFYTMDG